MVGEPTTVVWNAIKKLAPQLDKLQHKEDTITSEEVADPDLLREKFWEKVGTSLIDLAKSLDNQHQVIATHLKIGLFFYCTYSCRLGHFYKWANTQDRKVSVWL